ncbi:MAG TPA: chemotaxis protein CheW [Candidatus Xenobia bacterium]
MSVSKVDWQKVHAQLQATGDAILRGGSPSPEQRRSILRERAQELSQVEAQPPAGLHYMQVVGFRLGTRSFAVDASIVAEVYSYREIVPVPCTPAYILGLINARGQILSVADLKIFLGLTPTEPTRESKIMVWHSPYVEFGVLVDALYDVKEIVLESMGQQDKGDFVLGMTPDGVSVVDARRLMADRRLVIGEASG